VIQFFNQGGLNIFKKLINKLTSEKPIKSKQQIKKNTTITDKQKNIQENKRKSIRKGELGEYKINIQLDQLPKESKHLSDLLIRNYKSKTGYSQIDHVVISPYGLFVIETKNYAGKIFGKKEDEKWTINGKFKMPNPLNQNYGHIKAIENYLKDYKELIYISVISFTMRCRFSIDPELRKITSNDLIIYDVELSDYISRKLYYLKSLHHNPLLTHFDIVNIYNNLNKENLLDPEIRKEHIEKQKIIENNHEYNKKDNKCTVCGTSVSEKVNNFCLSNPKRFSGKIYCFDHQKDFN